MAERQFIFVVDSNTYKTFDDWKAILTGKEISPPEPKTNLVEMEGAAAPIDLTDWDGEIHYNNRTVSCTLFIDSDYGDYNDRTSLLHSIITALNGKRAKIYEPDNTTYYFSGRCKFSDIENKVSGLKLTISAECDPERYDSDGNGVIW